MTTFQIQTLHARTTKPASDNALMLHPNSPNPFIEMTLLWFSLPAAAHISLRISSASTGEEVYVTQGFFHQGENHIVLQRADLREPGFYTYTLDTPFGSASRKLMMY